MDFHESIKKEEGKDKRRKKRKTKYYMKVKWKDPQRKSWKNRIGCVR